MLRNPCRRMLLGLEQVGHHRVARQHIWKTNPLHSSTAPSRQLSSLTDRLKGEARKTFQRSTEVASDVLKKSSTAAMATVHANAKNASKKFSVEAKKAYEKGSTEAAKLYEKGSTEATKVFEERSYQATEALKRGTSTATDALQLTTKAASDKSYQAVTHTCKAIGESSKAATGIASERIRKSSLGAVMNAQEFGKKALRWLFLWSLAAVGVYGLATSIPTALLRYAVTGSGGSQEEEKGKTEPPTTVETQRDMGTWRLWESQNGTALPAPDEMLAKSSWAWPWGSSGSSGKD